MQEFEKAMCEVVDELKASVEKTNIRLGIEIAAVRNAYWYKELIAFLKEMTSITVVCILQT